MAGGGGGGSDEPEPTEEERALAKRGAQRWNRYVEDIVPATGTFAENIRSDASAKATADRQVVNPVRSQSQGNLRNAMMGNPRSTGGAAMALQQADNQASSTISQGANTARSDLMNRENRGLLALASSGRELQNQGTTGLARAGRDALQASAQQSENDMRFRQGITSALATGAGAYIGTQDFGLGSASGVIGDGGGRAVINGGMG